MTGSQLPIGVVRTDGKENLLTAIEIAGTWDSSDPETRPAGARGRRLLRGRADAREPLSQAGRRGFQALVSPNFPRFGEVGVHVRFRRDLLLDRGERRVCWKALNPGVTVVHLIPGMTPEALSHQLCIPGFGRPC